MSFGDLFGGGGSAGRIGTTDLSHRTSAVISQPLLDSFSVYKPVFHSSGLSLALQANMEGQGGDRSNRTCIAGKAGGGELESSLRRNKEDENESRSGGSDNLGGVSGDDLDLEQENPRKKKRYHRHTLQQIQELEGFFKECPHPDEKQRLDLSKRLSLETRQVKFWFQNRRTQMKTQMERHENTILRQENDKLRTENLSIKEAMRNPICNNCGSLAVLGEVSLEEQHLRVENARLKDELDRVCSLISKFIGKPLSSSTTQITLPMPSSTLELAVGSKSFANLSSMTSATLPSVIDFTSRVSSPLGSVITPVRNVVVGRVDRSQERLVFLELALAAMDELVKMAQMEEPLWISSLDGGRETLNYEEYHQNFPRCMGAKPIGFVSEATRSSCVVIINSLALVETLMDANRWADMFPSVIAKTTTADVISAGMSGSRNGALQLMHAELQVLSPLVPVRKVQFLRFCKQLADGAWAVVDVSIDGSTDNFPGDSMGCRRLPSGCVVQDMPNGYSKVTWVEHAEYGEAAVHPLYRPVLRSGTALGAPRWIAALQRQCQSLAVLMSSPPTDGANTITPSGRRSMVKLAQRMTDNFCAGVCSSSAHEWNKLRGGVHIGQDVRVMTRQSVADPGEPPGVVLSAATSVWLPATPQQLFDFLRNEQLRSQWDILSNGGPMQEMAHIAKGPDSGNAVYLLRASAVSADQSSMLILQETCTDESGSLVVYAPVDVPAMHLVMSGGDSSYVALLPSGFAILPDGNVGKAGGGSLLTVAFQILVNSLQPTAKLTVESVETVNNLISCTVQKIKAALNCDA